MMRHALIFAAALACLAPAPTLAQQPAAAAEPADIEARMELAREIAVIAGAERQLDLAFERMRAASAAKMFEDLLRVSPSRDIAGELDARYPGGRDAFEQEYGRRYADRFRSHYPEMLEEVAHYWATQMSLEELEASLAFFRTDLGSAWVELLPGVYEHMTALGREYSLQAGIAVAGEMMNSFDSAAPDEPDAEEDGEE